MDLSSLDDAPLAASGGAAAFGLAKAQLEIQVRTALAHACRALSLSGAVAHFELQRCSQHFMHS